MYGERIVSTAGLPKWPKLIAELAIVQHRYRQDMEGSFVEKIACCLAFIRR